MNKKKKTKPILICGLSSEAIEDIEKLIKERPFWVSRTQWILEAIFEKISRDGHSLVSGRRSE